MFACEISGRDQQGQGLRYDLDRHGQMTCQFTVDLSINAVIRRQRTCKALCTYNSDAIYVLGAPDQNRGEVAKITKRIIPLEEHHFKIRAKQGRTARNFQIASVVAHAAHQRKTAAVLATRNLHVELRQAAKHLAESARIVGQFSDNGLESEVQVIYDLRIQPRARHQQEMAVTDFTS